VSTDRFFDTMAAIIRKAIPWIGYAAIYEYSVATVNGDGTYDLRAVDITAGLPPLSNVPFKPGIPGLTTTLQAGSFVYVGFINHRADRPFIVNVAAPGDPGFTPSSSQVDASGAITVGHASSAVNLGGGYARVLRDGDPINMIAATVTPGAGSGVVKGFLTFDNTAAPAPGPPPTGFWTVKA